MLLHLDLKLESATMQSEKESGNYNRSKEWRLVTDVCKQLFAHKHLVRENQHCYTWFSRSRHFALRMQIMHMVGIYSEF